MDIGRATSLQALLGNLRTLVVWKTWVVLLVFGAGIGVGLSITYLSP